MVTIIGVPWDEQSSYLRGCAQGPAAIREAFWSRAANACTEDDLDLEAVRESGLLHDAVDLEIAAAEGAVASIESGIGRVLQEGGFVLALGGDHAITWPVVRAHAARYPRLAILHVDAHPDLYDEFEGSRLSHACPFARIMEAGLASRLVQVGIRTATPHQRDQARRFAVETVEMRDWRRDLVFAFDDPVYLSLDLDALDPAFAPGVSHHEPGGFSVRDVLHIIHGFRGRLVGADIVELNPARDVNGVTATVAAKLAREIAGRMIQQR